MSRFKDARLNLGLSLEEVADGICSPSFLSLVERGLRQPKPQLVQLLEVKLAKGFSNVADQFHPSDEYLQALGFLAVGDSAAVDASAENILSGQERALIVALLNEQKGEGSYAAALLEPILRNCLMSASQFCLAAQAMVRISRDLGDLYAAIYWAENTLSQLGQQWNDQSQTYELVATLSSVYLEVGDINRAKSLINSIQGKEVKDWDRVTALWAGGILAFTTGEMSKAGTMLREAHYLSIHSERELSKARILQTAIWIEARTGEALAKSASDDLERLSGYFKERGLIEDLAQALNTIALVYSKSGEHLLARKNAEASLELLIDLPTLSKAKLGIWNAEVILALGDREQAIAILHNTIQLLAGTPASRATATAWAEMAEIFTQLGDDERALDCLRSSAQAAGLIQANAAVRTPQK